MTHNKADDPGNHPQQAKSGSIADVNPLGLEALQQMASRDCRAGEPSPPLLLYRSIPTSKTFRRTGEPGIHQSEEPAYYLNRC